jgi:hypothetical protein
MDVIRPISVRGQYGNGYGHRIIDNDRVEQSCVDDFFVRLNGINRNDGLGMGPGNSASFEHFRLAEAFQLDDRSDI